ncbi:odorant receptor 122 isoform X1 [Nasonia vitripennis]|uniref:Odorant receptor n=1 Tax=Nasonia vitripennis TaxID=7425 RepID=A0A7M7QHD5_NASVI|nr:odorant receptor 122 [Nasonia vitripennis]XP_031786732.1 odorant receptor 122 isoform X1 [Nasonia vitripennis]
MDVLPLNFRTLWLCGIWHEENEKLTVPRIAYRFLVICLMFYFTFTLSAVVFVENSNVSELTEAIFLAVTYITLCLKIVNFAFRRAEMIEILHDFRHPYCKAEHSEESEILKGYSKQARKMYIYLMAFVMSDVAYFWSTFAFKVSKNIMELPYHTYQFYNMSSKAILFSTAALQATSVLYSVSINISFDTMTAGLLILTTGQLELNAHRLSKLGEHNVDSMNGYIAHNVLINGTVDKIESFIKTVVIPFLFFSLLSICASVFQLSEYSVFSLEFLGLFSFAICILLQVLVYCWFGNELMLKSEAVTDAIYRSDWTMLSPQNRKSLQVMMICNKDGRTVSFGGQCSLTLETFVWILKTSYATISLLNRVSA